MFFLGIILLISSGYCFSPKQRHRSETCPRSRPKVIEGKVDDKRETNNVCTQIFVKLALILINPYQVET